MSGFGSLPPSYPWGPRNESYQPYVRTWAPWRFHLLHAVELGGPVVIIVAAVLGLSQIGLTVMVVALWAAVTVARFRIPKEQRKTPFRDAWRRLARGARRHEAGEPVRGED